MNIFEEFTAEVVRYRLAWRSAARRARAWKLTVQRLRGELAEAYATSARMGKQLDRAVVERDEARADVEMYGTAYHAIQQVLDGAIGGGVDDGEGAGIVADVALVVAQRDDARNALERVAVERDEARAEAVRLGKALEAIHQKWMSTHDAWHPNTKYASQAADSWHQGYVTALATTSIMARQALDPDAEDEWGKDVDAARGTDRMWFERTGNCGHCGLIAEDCDCRPDDPCGCGPHELRTVPRQCWRCKGSGWDHPRGVSVDQAVLPIDEMTAATDRLRAALDEERIEPERAHPSCGEVGPTGGRCWRRGSHAVHQSSTGDGGSVSWPARRTEGEAG